MCIFVYCDNVFSTSKTMISPSRCLGTIIAHLDVEERAGCFTLFVFLMSCNCYVALTHVAMGWSVVCDCGIFLTILTCFFQSVHSPFCFTLLLS